MPGKDVECRPSKWFEAVDVSGQPFVRVRKLEIRNYFNYGIFADGCTDVTVEDNYIHHCGVAFWGGIITGSVVRRNTFTDLMGTGVGVERLARHGRGRERASAVEQEPLQGGLLGRMRDHLQRCRALVLRNNVIADGPDSGVWPDCCGNGITIYGNTIYRVRGDGFYIEAGVYGTILRWNTVFDSGSGITFRENFGNNAFENYIFRTGRALGIGTCDQNNLPKSNVMMYNWLIDNGMGAAFGPDVSGRARPRVRPQRLQVPGLARRGPAHPQARGHGD